MTATAKRIELLRALQDFKQDDEKPGDTILRIFRENAARSANQCQSAYERGYRAGFSDCEQGCINPYLQHSED